MRVLRADGREKDRVICQNCGKPLDGQNPRRRFCGGRCRAEASRRRRAEAVRVPLVEAMGLLNQVQAAIEEAREALAGNAEDNA